MHFRGLVFFLYVTKLVLRQFGFVNLRSNYVSRKGTTYKTHAETLALRVVHPGFKQQHKGIPLSFLL